ncbi:MAG: alpha/beta hydrolase [Proteobacteria bacterium]|nr:alpha/beta hydrolase [Pseudomonadota bacterium]NDC25463.1 alpha/beta hydrolase [Pseudomonadota bacterium]NDD05280.1 alpha/beta hydrolase [Pseudomonadota bacterium]NDG27762.1 alpha/beta hydrolase [Pseudomonadota bacterium]
MSAFFVEKLAVWSTEPSQVPSKGRVILVHGMSEHSGRHLNTEQALLKDGYSVVRFDLRGSGQSGGRRQWIEKFTDYVDDVASVYRWICREQEPLPLFLLGHSLGGAIAMTFMQYYQKAFRGLILSAPAYLTGDAINPYVIALGKQLVKVIPTFRVSGNSDKSAISRDPEVVKQFLSDPLCCHTNTLNQGREVLDQLPKLKEIASTLTLPVLFAHGSLDKIVKLEGSFELLNQIRSRDKNLYIMPGGYHEPHNDLDKNDYFVQLTQWLNKHLTS